MLKYFDKTQPISVGESYSREKYPKIDLIENKLLPVFLGYSSETDFIPLDEIDQYFTFITQRISWLNILDINGNPTTEKQIETF